MCPTSHMKGCSLEIPIEAADHIAVCNVRRVLQFEESPNLLSAQFPSLSLPYRHDLTDPFAWTNHLRHYVPLSECKRIRAQCQCLRLSVLIQHRNKPFLGEFNPIFLRCYDMTVSNVFLIASIIIVLASGGLVRGVNAIDTKAYVSITTRSLPIGTDPPGQGLIKEYTDRDGGFYMLGDTVLLFALVTFAGDPVANKLVAFQVLDPSNTTALIDVAFTDGNGIAVTSFRLPEIVSNVGTWTAFATVELDQVAYSDVIAFQVRPLSTVGGYSFVLKSADNSVNLLAPYSLVSVTLTFSFVVCGARARRPRNHRSARKPSCHTI